MKKILSSIVSDIQRTDFFSDFKYRKRDCSFNYKTSEGRQFVELDHWIDDSTSSLVIYPIYAVRFDILSRWFERFSLKTIQDQRDRPSIAFSGDMISQTDTFNFKLNGIDYDKSLMLLLQTLVVSSRAVFRDL